MRFFKPFCKYGNERDLYQQFGQKVKDWYEKKFNDRDELYRNYKMTGLTRDYLQFQLRIRQPELFKDDLMGDLSNYDIQEFESHINMMCFDIRPTKIFRQNLDTCSEDWEKRFLVAVENLPQDPLSDDANYFIYYNHFFT